MLLSKITITHSEKVEFNDVYIIYYTDAVTGIPGSINATNLLGDVSMYDWPQYFVTNSVFSSGLFSTTISGDTFTFQAKTPNIIFNKYEGYRDDPALTALYYVIQCG